MRCKLAVVISHPIQYFSPWFREIARRPEIDLRVFYCRNMGVEEYKDETFGIRIKWDVPLLEGYEYEFLATNDASGDKPFWKIDNPLIVKSLQSFGPDAVLVFGYGLRGIWRAASWTRRHSIPLMVFSDSNFKRKNGLLRRLVKSVVVGWFYRHVDGAYVHSGNNRDYHRHFGVPEDRLFPGVFPIDQERLLSGIGDRDVTRSSVRERHGIPANAFVVLFCGKLASHKRPLDVVVAAQRASAAERPVWCLIVGEGSERPEIEAYCHRERITKCVLAGFVNQSRLPEYYSAADVMVLPSAIEAYGVVVTEAAVFGLPAIVSDQVGCVGTTSAARPGENAFVFTCGDCDRIGEYITLLCNDQTTYSRMSAASSAIAQEHDAKQAALLLTATVMELCRLGPRQGLRRSAFACRSKPVAARVV